MQEDSLLLPAMQFIGTTVRTNNVSEMDPSTAKIGSTVAKYFQQQLAERIPQRKAPGKTYQIYTEYVNDHHGDYTYFIGEEVADCAVAPPEFVVLSIPAQRYIKFSHGPGQMPEVCLQAWQYIWALSASHFDQRRSYLADFEIHSTDQEMPQHTRVDIYIGVNR